MIQGGGDDLLAHIERNAAGRNALPHHEQRTGKRHRATAAQSDPGCLFWMAVVLRHERWGLSRIRASISSALTGTSRVSS